MDSATEKHLLLLIEQDKDIILNLSNTKESREKRKLIWEKIRQNLLVETGKQFEIEQLQKKWNNCNERLKKVLIHRKGTGGGPQQKLTENDEFLISILGEQNPKLFKVTGAMENATPISNSLTSSSFLNNVTSQLPSSFSHCKSSKSTADICVPDLTRSSQMQQLENLVPATFTNANSPTTSSHLSPAHVSALQSSAKRLRLCAPKEDDDLEKLHMEVVMVGLVRPCDKETKRQSIF